MKKLHTVAITLGMAGVLVSTAAVALDKSLPYRVGLTEYSRYLWAGRFTEVSVGLALLTLLCGTAARKGWLPFALGLVSLSPLLIIGGVHSGPNPQAWCYNNLRKIEGAKEQLVHERGLTSGSPVTMSQIAPSIPAGSELRCAERGTYLINSIGSDARCTFHGSIAEMEAEWQRQMQAQPGGAANRGQPVGSETNRVSAATGSGGGPFR